jgi:NAD(P)-dependent dehydrogenase (short-subunit alcohol dehydrogenase family)
LALQGFYEFTGLNMTVEKQELRYSGRAALVTGGGSGLGEAICHRLAREGARVAVLDRHAEAADRVVKDIRALGGQADAFAADVTQYESLEKAVSDVVRAYGGLDLAVNNAGIGSPFLPTAEHSLDNWNQIIAVNLTGVFHSMKAEIPHMTARGGAIVNIASITALVGVAGIAPYVTAKHGVLGLTKSAALEYGKFGIRVTAVCPTFIKTPLTTAELKDDQQWAALDAMHALGHCAVPEDVAAMVAFLGSNDGRMLTGCAYPVDGGITAA